MKYISLSPEIRDQQHNHSEYLESADPHAEDRYQFSNRVNATEIRSRTDEVKPGSHVSKSGCSSTRCADRVHTKDAQDQRSDYEYEDVEDEKR